MQQKTAVSPAQQSGKCYLSPRRPDPGVNRIAWNFNKHYVSVNTTLVLLMQTKTSYPGKCVNRTYVHAISLPLSVEKAHTIAHAGQLHRWIGEGEVSENTTFKWVVQLCRTKSKDTMPNKDPKGTYTSAGNSDYLPCHIVWRAVSGILPPDGWKFRDKNTDKRLTC